MLNLVSEYNHLLDYRQVLHLVVLFNEIQVELQSLFVSQLLVPLSWSLLPPSWQEKWYG